MASADDKRVSKQEIVQGSFVTVSKNSPDYVFLKDNKDIGIVDPSTIFNYSNYSSSAYLNVPATGGQTATKLPSPLILPAAVIEQPDIPYLADIESVQYEEYFDSVTGITKYKAILKIRNSSKNSSDISGVDARIYNPNGVNEYTFGTSTATTSSPTPTYVSNVTWYNATARVNVLSGLLISAGSLNTTAQYPADGSNVPADSTSGPFNNRTISVWRKTQAEAISAADEKAGVYI